MATANPFNAQGNPLSHAGNTIEVVPYNPHWPAQFEQEAAKIKAFLGEKVNAIHHIGSTSVPGLAAKRDIDIVLVTTPLQNALSLENIGYIFKGELNIPLRYFFSKNTPETKVNLHVCEQEHGFTDIQLAFRDRLRTHQEDRAAYQQLKYELLKDPRAGARVRGIFTTYSLGKGDIIKKTLRKSGYNGINLRFCLDDQEWEAAKHYRNHLFFQPLDSEDPYTWTFTHKDHKHFVLYKGVEIIGYAHIELWPHKRAAIRIIGIDPAKHRQGYGKKLISLLEKWLKLQAYQSLHLKSFLKTAGFYEHLGYVPMPFNSPDTRKSFPKEITLGKCYEKRDQNKKIPSPGHKSPGNPFLPYHPPD